MLGTLTKFELAYQTRQIGFWVVVIIMFGLGMLSMSLPDIFGADLAGQKIKVNGAQMVAGQIASWDFAAVFFGAVFVVTGVLRDRNYNMVEFIHSTPVSTFDMTASRMIGAFLIIAACIFSNTIGQFIGQFMPWIDDESLGPVRVHYFLQPALVFTFFNALFVTAFFTLIAGLTQNRTIVYVSAIALLFVSIMSSTITEIDPPRWVEALIDPFGGLAFGLDTEYWPPEERNARLTPLFGFLGLNRLFWFAVSCGIFLLVFGKFRRGLVSGKTKRIDSIELGEAAHVSFVKPTFGIAQSLRSALGRTWMEYRMTVRSIPFMILASLAIVLFAFIIIVTVFLAPQKLVPTSRIMAQVAFGSLLIPMIIMIAFFSGELIWRERTHKTAEVMDALPIQNGAYLVGKWLALIGIVLTLLVIGMIVGIIAQIIFGGTSVNLSTYLRFVFLNAAPNFIALTILALFAQTFSPNRIVGMLLAAGLMIGVQFFIGRLPFYHPLIGFGGTSPGSLSEISPYTNWVRFRWFNMYWGALCLLFGVVSLWLWRRGLQVGVFRRFAEFPRRMTPLTALLAGVFAVVFVGSGLRIYAAYDSVDYRNQKQRELRQVKFENMLGDEVELIVPTITAVDLDVEIYPARQDAVVGGVFQIENTRDEAIEELYINLPTSHPEDVRRLEIGGADPVREGENAEGDSVTDIEDFNYRLFKFNPPLAPGDTSEIRFETYFHPPKLADGSIILRNGTFLNSHSGGSVALPRLGVFANFMTNPDKRRKYGLDEMEDLPDRDDQDARYNSLFAGSSAYIDFESRICTSENQIPVTPGDMISETVSDGRRCRNYRSDEKINNFYSILSADFQVREDSWTAPDGREIPIHIYYGAPHTYSIDEMVEAVKYGLGFFTETYGPYPYNYVRIMEVPYIGYAQAFAGTIPFSEDGFIMDAGDPEDIKRVDNAFRTTLHELGHQWFAHQIVPAMTRGFNVLSEGLTSYVTMEAYENKLGWKKAKTALERSTIEEMIALQMFDRDDEPPLALAQDEQYLVYNKSDWVMWGLKHYIGADKVNGALREFLDDYGYTGAPYPTTLELIEYLREAAGPEYQQLITDYWDRITYWDLAYGDGDIDVRPDGNSYDISFTLSLDKKISTEDEPEQISVTEIDGEALDEWIEIGFYDAENDPNKTLGDDWFALEQVKVTEMESELRFDMEQAPAYIALDPRRLLMERNVEDNIKPVRVAGSDS